MLPLDDSSIRSALINTSQRERKAVTLPELGGIDWPELDFLAWRDAKLDRTAYVTVELEGEVVAFMLREATGRPRSRPQCSWCDDVHLPNPVSFFTARRAGAAGRAGNTVGTLICSNFECSSNVRRPPTSATAAFDPEGAVRRRIEVLREHARGFARSVLGDA